VDDDCSGEADEDFVPIPIRCGLGVCSSAGRRRCGPNGETWDDCEPGAAPEALEDLLCDGRDEDCDGETDEDFVAERTCGRGPCVAWEVCRAGVASCTPAPGSPETCDNGVDDDCDGAVDEAIGCCQPGHGPLDDLLPEEDRWVLVCPGTRVLGSPGPECAAECQCGIGDALCADTRCPQGCPGEELLRQDDEAQRQVNITRPFLMQATEVTQQQWLRMTWEEAPVPNPSHFGDGAHWRCNEAGCGRRPVEQVSWYDALAYCNWLSANEGLQACYVLRLCTDAPGNGLHCNDVEAAVEPIQACQGYRLPTEAEWEIAARAGRASAFPGGDLTQPDAGQVDPALGPWAWYGANGGDQSHDVATRAHNGWGLFDLHGNVMEWCWDEWGDDPPSGPVDDPVTEGRSWERQVRGGSWGSPADVLRSGGRGYRRATDFGSYIGFRPVRSVHGP